VQQILWSCHGNFPITWSPGPATAMTLKAMGQLSLDPDGFLTENRTSTDQDQLITAA